MLYPKNERINSTLRLRAPGAPVRGSSLSISGTRPLAPWAMVSVFVGFRAVPAPRIGGCTQASHRLRAPVHLLRVLSRPPARGQYAPSDALRACPLALPV